MKPLLQKVLKVLEKEKKEVRVYGEAFDEDGKKKRGLFQKIDQYVQYKSRGQGQLSQATNAQTVAASKHATHN